MKREMAVTRHIENDELSDNNVPIGQGHNRRIRRAKREEQEPLRNNFTIKNVEDSLSYFTGDDKLPIEN